ncbi:LPS export ABC transporter periplasmic protein LptC [Marinomonas agarivorans]|nr:LPS export ABC transporter periplasmic protein LptC [Marinomonas agarivorans]
MRKWPLISIILAVVILVSTTFWFGVTPKSTLVEASNLSSTPDFFAQGITILQYNRVGELTQEVHAEELKQNQTAQTTTLSQPLLIQYQDNTSWHISARSGDIVSKSNNIILSGDVTAIKDQGSDTSVTLFADKIQYENKKNLLTGTGNIAIHSASSNIKADKITLFIDTNQLSLEGSVRGTHENAK